MFTTAVALADSGSNVNTISHQVFDRLLIASAVSPDTRANYSKEDGIFRGNGNDSDNDVPGTVWPIGLDPDDMMPALADCETSADEDPIAQCLHPMLYKSTRDIQFGERHYVQEFQMVRCYLRFLLQGTPLIIPVDLTVFDVAGEDIVLSKQTLAKHGLLSYIENPSKWKLDHDKEAAAPEESMISSPEAWVSQVDTYSFENVDVNPDCPDPKAIKDILREASRVFDPMTRFDVIQGVPPFHIDLLPGAQPKKQRPRRTTPDIQKAIDQQVEEWEKLGVVEKNLSSPVASPVVPVKKPGGPPYEYRVCVDYRELNNMSVKSQFPTAQIWEEMGRLAHKRYFALLDLKRAFNQCLVSPSTRDLLTFVTMNGTYSFLHVPFGPTNVPGWFRSIFARTVLEGMDQIVCEVFVDDVAIHGTTWEEFLDNLRAVVMRLAQHNVHCGI